MKDAGICILYHTVALGNCLKPLFLGEIVYIFDMHLQKGDCYATIR